VDEGKGVSAPLTVIIVTAALLFMTSAMAAASLVSLGSSSGGGGLDTAISAVELHESLEQIYTAPPGTTITLFIDMPSGAIIITDHGMKAQGSMPNGLIDYAGIVVSESQNEINYNSTLLRLAPSPAIVGPGLSEVVLCSEMSGGIKVIDLEVSGG
jgi:hypothetical protein